MSVQAHFCKSCKSANFFPGVGEGQKWTLRGFFLFLFLKHEYFVALCERTHSKLKVLNNYYLQSSMSSDRLENLVQISRERDIANTIKLETLVDIFKLKS